MNISFNWLKRHIVFTEENPQKVMEILTEKSAEGEALHFEGAELENIVVGQIERIEAHPNADSLKICHVSVGANNHSPVPGDTSPIQIVCGGSNLSLHQKVAVAKLGASVKWHGEGDPIVMKKTAIRGVESEGMICASDEIGCSDLFPKSGEKEIVDLSAFPHPPGTPLAEVLGKDDIILEVENTAITNRPDLFSHIGFAREMVACGVAEWKNDVCRGAIYGAQNDDQKGVINHAPTNAEFPISITFPENAEKVVPEYCAIAISGVDGKKESPEEMQKLLKSVGIQPKNALVDITNFVMFDLGMPLHAFDRDRVGKNWIFEITKGGEKMVNLDGNEKTLPANAIILRDESGEIFDCCGIQGGKNSGIVEETSKILLHAPVYDPVKIRRTAIAIDHRTDAATIYEKGVALPLAKKGLLSAVERIVKIFPEAKIETEIFQKSFVIPPSSQMEVPLSTITRILGHDLSADEVLKILGKLGIEGEFSPPDRGELEGGALSLTIPSWRTDLVIPEDIAEEVARMYGLNNIPGKAPEITITEQHILPIRQVEQRIADIFVASGFYEILSFAFLGERLLDRCGMEKDEEKMIFLKNPLSEELSIMRSSLSPRLLETAEKNRRYKENFRIFESGKVFKMEGETKIEEERITALLVGDDFYTAKGIAERIFTEFGIPHRIEPKDFSSLPFAHPAKGALLKGGRDASIKILQIHPKTAKEFHLPENSAIVCITLSPFIEFLGRVKKIKELPRFPGVTYDISVVCEKKLAVEDLIKNPNKIDPLIVSAKITDIWEGKGVEEGKKSVTVSYEFCSPEKTLEEKEIKDLEKKVLGELEKRGGVFRFGE